MYLEGKSLYDVIVLGGGPAGLTAAMYASRGKLNTLVITGSIGGQIALTYQVDNYPGFPNGLTGPELSERFKAHAAKFGTEFIDGEVTRVDFRKRPYRIWVGDDEYDASSVIIATGMMNRKLGVPGEDRLMGRGVFVCATCDAILYEDRRVVVVGGGDSAIQEALDLAKFAKEVIVVHRRGNLRACRCLSDRARESSKINFRLNNVVEEIIGEKKVEQIKLKDLRTGQSDILDVDGVLVAIGWDPNTNLFKEQLEMDSEGYIVSVGSKTSLPGIFVAGDLMDREYRQVVTSCGSGCSAAIEAERWLLNNNG